MKLDKYINDLLFLHDCVIISDFGGFVAHYRPSYLHKDFHTISPPSKVIAFNKDLNGNDGLLANYISRKTDISYQQACDHIRNFADHAMKELEAGRIFHIEHVGQFEYDREKNLQFRRDPESNYLISSYGLSIVHSPAIAKPDAAEGLSKKRPTNKNKPKKTNTLAEPVKNSKKKRSTIALLEVVPVALVMLFLLIYPSYVNTLNDKLASIIPTTNNFDANWMNSGDGKDDVNSDAVKKNLGTVLLEEQNVADQEEEGTDSTEEFWEEGEPPVADEAEEQDKILEEAIASLEASAEEYKTGTRKEADEEKIDPAEVVEPENSKPEANTELKSGTVLDSKFYIIGGCFSVFENAEKMLVKLESEGFPAQLAGQNQNGLHMVAFDGAATLSEARQKLDEVRAKSYDSAWVYRPR